MERKTEKAESANEQLKRDIEKWKTSVDIAESQRDYQFEQYEKLAAEHKKELELSEEIMAKYADME
ncbi:MAG: hypothetical protein IJS29_02310 [Selenomonadaceae bacterium]|nr:hypothetical protein [Selenomonadaceae bacterium]